MNITTLHNEKKKPIIPFLRFKGFTGEWENNTLSELSTKITDGTHDTPKPTKEGVPFLTAIHIKDGFVDYNNCYYLEREVHNSIFKRCNPEKDDLLIVNIGAGTATCAINSVNYEFSLKNVALVKPNKDILNGNFLAQIQRKKSSKIFNQLTSGGAQPFLSLREIGRLKISFPSLLEQQKIASFLSAIDEKIQQLSRKKELLEQYKKGVMQQLFSGKLRFKDENGKDYADWEEKKFGEVAHITMGQSPESKSYNLDSYGMLLIQGNADIKNRVTAPRQWSSHPTKTCKIGDLILTVRAPVGAVAKSIHNACIGRGVCSIINNNYSIQEYLYQFLLIYESKWASLEQGSTFTAVNVNDIKGLKLNLPSLPEQQKIANFLSNIDVKIENTNQEINQMQNFKKGLLQQMFV